MSFDFERDQKSGLMLPRGTKPPADTAQPARPQPLPRPARPRKFIPRVGTMLNLESEDKTISDPWRIIQVKSRGRWKAQYVGEGEPTVLKPETGMGLNFGEPGIVQLIFNAHRRRFWARPVPIVHPAAAN